MNINSSHLTPISFNILLALSIKPCHGYELAKQITQDSLGRVKTGPGTLYGSIKTLESNNLIEELPNEDDSRRRYYRLTQKGWQHLSSDAAYYVNSAKLLKERRII